MSRRNLAKVVTQHVFGLYKQVRKEEMPTVLGLTGLPSLNVAHVIRENL